MSKFIQMNDKVKEEYQVFISIKDEKSDMFSSINQYLNDGYEKVYEIEDLDNVIVVIRKK